MTSGAKTLSMEALLDYMFNKCPESKRITPGDIVVIIKELFDAGAKIKDELFITLSQRAPDRIRKIFGFADDNEAKNFALLVSEIAERLIPDINLERLKEILAANKDDSPGCYDGALPAQALSGPEEIFNSLSIRLAARPDFTASSSLVHSAALAFALAAVRHSGLRFFSTKFLPFLGCL